MSGDHEDIADGQQESEPTPEKSPDQCRIEELETLLEEIGDYAHGKTNELHASDGYWRIYEMACGPNGVKSK